MQDSECVDFLQASLPRLGLRWAGYRKVRRTVCKRLQRRLAELGLPSLAAYRAHLDTVPAEWYRLDAMCRIPISRFYRDRAVFDCLGAEILPTLASAAIGRGVPLRCWSAGCASGEEPYSVTLLWEIRCRRAAADLACTILATDADPVMLERARQACYGPGSLRDLPADLRATFTPADGQLCLRAEFREHVTFRLQDIRRDMPEGPFDLILCRNLVLTYLDSRAQRGVLLRLAERLAAGGAFVIGRHERLPALAPFAPWHPDLGIFRRRTSPEQTEAR